MRYLLPLGFLLLVVAGCGPQRPPMGKVQGVVTLDGEPLSAGSIQFWPDVGRPSRSSINEDGTYELTTFDAGDGALVGNHVVTIKSTRLTEADPEISSTQEEIEYYREKRPTPIRAAKVVWIIPEKYSERRSTPLTAKVVEGDNEINFDIPSAALEIE